MKCENCVYADVSKEPRVIKRDNMTIIQKQGGINCTCESIKSITVNNGNMVCSEFKESED